MSDNRFSADRNDHGKTDDAEHGPTLAVALDYDPARDKAPKVVASGRNAVADQILQIAFANGVKVREDADLAQLLSALDIDSEIPVEAFAAVAEILIYVYRASGGPVHLPETGHQAAEGPF